MNNSESIQLNDTVKENAGTKLKVVRVVTASYVVPWHLNNTLRRMPADFDVCVVGHDVSINKESYPNVKFVDIQINRKASLISDVLALIALCKLFISYKPDIVHSIMPKAGLLTSLAGFICRVPIRIHTFTGQTWAAKKGFSSYFYYCLDQLINFLNTTCLTDSPSQSTFLRKRGISIHGQSLPVLSKGSLSGVDVTRFNMMSFTESVGQLRASLGVSKEHFVFSFIARKTRDKGAVDILKAFSSVAATNKEARLLFVGPDEDGEIELLYKTNPKLFVNVIDIGYVSNPEVYLAITDVLCLPSYREGFGSIVIDAAAMGVPTIGSNIPGLIDSVEDNKTGLLFPVGDIGQLANIMLTFSGNPSMCITMGVNAKARVDEFFTADKLYFALKEFYYKCALSNYKTRQKLGRLL